MCERGIYSEALEKIAENLLEEAENSFRKMIYVNLNEQKAYTEEQFNSLAKTYMYNAFECDMCRKYIGKEPYQAITLDDMVDYLVYRVVNDESEWMVAWMDE